MYIHFIFRRIFGASKRLLFRVRPHTFQFVFAMMPNSTGNPQRETMFDHSAVPTPSGFKPTSASLNMQSMIEKKANMATEAAFFSIDIGKIFRSGGPGTATTSGPSLIGTA